MSSAHQPPEPPRWDRGDAANDSDAAARAAKGDRVKSGSKTGAKSKSDQSAAGEEDPGSALDSLDQANGQPETKKPSKS